MKSVSFYGKLSLAYIENGQLVRYLLQLLPLFALILPFKWPIDKNLCIAKEVNFRFMRELFDDAGTNRVKQLSAWKVPRIFLADSSLASCFYSISGSDIISLTFRDGLCTTIHPFAWVSKSRK